MLKLIFFITLIVVVSLLAMESIYAETYNSINNNSNNFKTANDNSSSLSSYRFEPFLSVNGTDYKDISPKDSLSLDNFAIAAWIKTNQTNLTEPAHIVNKGGFNNEDKGKNMNYGIWLSKNGNVQGGFENEDGEVFEVTSTTRYNDGKWHYILLSYDGILLRLYVDGKQVSAKYIGGVIPDKNGDQPLRIGANSLDEDKFFSGKVDEVRLWNRGLTNSEIAEIYSNGTFNTIGQVYYQDFKNIFNIAVAADWGCDENATKTAKNIQEKNPELVIAAGDLSYDESADCWFEIIEPFKSKTKIAMGDHEYSDTSGGAIGIIDQYLKPLNLTKTYYSFDMNNIHVTVIDPFIDYKPGSSQYQFIENDLRNASNNQKIDWKFVVESTPIYTSPSDHPANSTIRDTYHPLFDKYGIDIVFTSDNHNYQRTFPLKYNSEGGNSSNPIIADKNLNNYSSSNNSNDNYSGQIYMITGIGGRSLYPIYDQSPFVAKQNDDQYGFVNLDFTTNNTLTATVYANEKDSNNMTGSSNNANNNLIDQFRISKTN
jgi:hypothetical protein